MLKGERHGNTSPRFLSDYEGYFTLKYILDPACALIGQKPMFYPSIKHRKSVFYCFARVKSIS